MSLSVEFSYPVEETERERALFEVISTDFSAVPASAGSVLASWPLLLGGKLAQWVTG